MPDQDRALRTSPSATLVILTLVVQVVSVAACSGPAELAGEGDRTEAECALVNTDVLQGPEDVVEEMPDLIGGLNGIQRRLEYTDEARRNRIEGRVYVQFTVNTRGVPVDFIVTQSLDDGLDRAAIRAVSEARFKPAKRDGCPVPVRMSLPITFRLR